MTSPTSNINSDRTGLEIAVIGMALKFPGAQNIDEFWENLKNGVESLTFYTDRQAKELGVSEETLKEPNFIKTSGGLLANKEYFDAAFFGYTPQEAELLNPQIRAFYKCSWEALENAGYNPFTEHRLIGIYAGASPGFQWEALAHLSGKNDVLGTFASALLTDENYLCSRVSYHLNLRGPAVSIQTACSTSLVAIHMACQALLNGECDLALAGGVSVSVGQRIGYFYQEGMIQSADGHNRAFDKKASGMAMGEGVGVVLLKPLEQALKERDTIHALIKGTAVNNDGQQRMGFTAPSLTGQAEVIRMSHQVADVEPGSITYIETHGTATPLGDVVEVNALKRAFKIDKKGYCAIGSVKTNIGHLGSAAGAAGFIKTILALKHRQIPPSLHFETPNPDIDFENSPFYVNNKLKAWKNDHFPLRAGVSSFGIGGTNAHIILEEAPETCIHAGKKGKKGERMELIPLSGRTGNALEKISKNLAEFLKQNPDVHLADVAYTLQVGRRELANRRMLVCTTVEEAIDALNSPVPGLQTELTQGEKPFLVFMFSGLGGQYVNMGLELYQKEAVFRREMDRCFDILKPLLNYDIKGILYPGMDSLNKTVIDPIDISQLVVFIFAYALAKMLIKWGIKPQAMIGYSFGEYMAACTAGVFSLEDALKLVVIRGRLMNRLAAGVMLSVPLPAEELTPQLPADLSLAIDNGPSCVVAGAPEAVAVFEAKLKNKRIITMRLSSTRAVHSHMMEPLLVEFEKNLRDITFNEPQIPYISNVTGGWITPGMAVDPRYWTAHLRKTVRFADGIRELVKYPAARLVEIGPGNDVTTLAARHMGNGYLENRASQRVMNLVKPPGRDVPDHYYLLNKIGRLWLWGVTIDWTNFASDREKYRIPLPTYPFEEERYWIDYNPTGMDIKSFAGNKPALKRAEISDWFYVPSWKREDISAGKMGKMTDNSCWLLFMDECGLGHQLADQLEKAKQVIIIIKAGVTFRQETGRCFVINYLEEKDYEALFVELVKLKQIPSRIIHLWSIMPPAGVSGELRAEVDADRVNKALALGFYSINYIARAVGKLGIRDEISLMAIINNLHEITGGDGLCPEKATVLGPVRVIPIEYPNIDCRCIDIVLPPAGSTMEKKFIRQLLNESLLESAEPVTAYRNGYRWVPVCDPVPIKSPDSNPARLRTSGVYLVTGGLGGIGLVLAEYLARTVRAKLILTGRTEFPARSEWDQWLAVSQTGDTIEKIRKVKTLEKMGAEVLIFSVDAADAEQMAQVINRAEKQWGPINGIIHCAGVADGEMIQLRKRETSMRVMEPKISGILTLNHLLKNKDLDFTIFCSALNAIVPTVGQVGYCAANAFLDAFAHYRHAAGYFTISINWDRWQGVGISNIVEKLHKKLTGEDLTGGISQAEGVDCFARVLSEEFPQVIVSIRNFSTPARGNHKFKASLFMAGLEQKNAPAKVLLRPELGNEYVAPSNEIQHALTLLWSKFFGYQKVGIKDDFFELGGDSLKALILIPKIHKQLNVEIPITELFRRPTIEKLSEYILETAVKSTFSPVEKVEEREYYALSPAQNRLFILQQIDPGSMSYNIPLVVVLTGEHNREQLRDTFRKLIGRHESLRTSFEVIKGAPVQRIHKEVKFEIEYYNLPLEDKIHHTSSVINHFIRSFDLAKPPLLRAGLIKTGEQTHILMVDMHHIIADGVSHAILVQDFMALYAGVTLPDIPIQYKDFSIWQNRLCESGEIKAQEEYWLQQFAGEIPVLALPTDYPRPKVQSFEGEGMAFHIDKNEEEALKALALKEGATMFMVLLSLFDVVLSKISNQEDILVGTPIAGRRHADLERVIGMFVNTLVLRGRPRGELTFIEFLKQVKEETLEAFENQDYQFEELVEHVTVTRDVSRNPLFDVVFVMPNVDVRSEVDELPVGKRNELRIHPYKHENKISKFDLTLMIVEHEERLTFNVEYCTRLFKESTIERFIDYFKRTLSEIIEYPGKKISDIEIIPGSEKHRLLYDFNNTRAEYPEDKTIHELFEEQVERLPDLISLVYSPAQISYRELKEKSDRLAFSLQGHGVQPDNIVGIMVKRSLEMVIGILGILKAGGAYLPIDPEYPGERIEYMLKDSGTAILLTDFEKEKMNNCQLPIVNSQLSMSGCLRRGLKGCPRRGLQHSNQLAYIIYTSGTTGKPKGVMVEHKNVVRLMINDKFQFQFGSSDVWTMFHEFNFDFSVWEMYGALLYGGRLIVIPKMTARDPRLFLKVLLDQKITVLNQTPSAFYNLSDEALKTNNNDLCIRYVIFGGEALKPARLNAWRQKYPGTKLVNMFGITETCVHVTYKEIGAREIEGDIGNIGKPIPTLSTYIMDRYQRLTPMGTPGELYVGGEGVTRGYLNRPELTSERFVKRKQERLYRSGDLARMDWEGEMVYLGRVDQQVQLRGFRIELGEIENRLLKHEGIKEAVVMERSTSSGDLYLCAYIVPLPGVLATDLETASIREFLSRQLPGYMIPSYIVQLEAIPLTSNGKIDRRRLPQPEVSIGKDHKLPRNKIEEKLAETWQEVLGLKSVGIEDNFFDVGGDSIKAIRLISRINERLESNLKIVDLYFNRTISELAGLVDREEPESVQALYRKVTSGIEELKNRFLEQMKEQDKWNPDEIEDVYPMSEIEKGMVFNYMKYAGRGIYHDQFVYPLYYKDFDIELFKKTLTLVVKKNEILRTGFNLDEFEEPVQVVYKEPKLNLEYTDLSQLPSHNQFDRVEKWLSEDKKNPFESSKQPLWRMHIFTFGNHRLYVLLTFHHAILDGWSTATLMTEIHTTYSRLKGNPTYVPSGLRTSYRDAVIQERVEKENDWTLQYWKEELKDYLRLEFRETTKSKSEMSPMKLYLLSAGEEILQRAKQAAAQWNTGIKNLCFSAYAYMMRMFSYENDMVLGCVSHNRAEGPDGDKVLGCFLNTVPVRLQIPTSLSWKEYAVIVERKMQEVKKHERLPLFEIALLTGEKNKDRNPFFDTLFNFTDFHLYQQAGIGESNPGTAIEKSDFPVIQGHQDTNTFFDFEVDITIGNLLIHPKYNAQVISDSMVKKCCIYFVNILDKYINDPDSPIRRDDILPLEEKEALLQRFNDTQGDYSREKTVPMLFEEQVLKTPDNTALIDVDGLSRLTYRQLNEKTSQLAHGLRKMGVKTGDFVGVVMERRMEMVWAVMGILKAGGAYVPLEPYLPDRRIEKILESLQAKCVITDDSTRPRLEIMGASLEYLNHMVNLDKMGYRKFEDNPLENPAPVSGPQDISYVIYTSGSTGTPKGVVETHRPVVNVIQWVNKMFDVGDKDKLLFVASLGFDLSVYDIFGILASGGTIRTVDLEHIKDPVGLLDIMVKEGITFWDSAPAALQQLVPFFSEVRAEGQITALRLVFLSGDWIPVSMPDALRETFKGVRVISLGGATEATIWSNYYPIGDVDPSWSSIPYGKPIQNARYYILDNGLNLCPVNTAGDLYIGGECLAKEYQNDPELTANKFIANPFCPGEKMYKTGDIARWFEDGNMQFLGRKDHQVKIRGYRIELGEIESQLAGFPGIREAIVIDRKDGSGNKYICAYYTVEVGRAGEKIEKKELITYLSGELPEYMMPVHFIPLEQVPLTPNGKLDRNALPEPELNIEKSYTAPGDELQEKILEIWQEVLFGHDGRYQEKVATGIDDDFFELGGHSLNATIVIAKIHKMFNVKVPLTEMFRRPTIRELAELIKKSRKEKYSEIPVVEKKEYYHLSFAQKRLYVLQQMNPESTAYNMPEIFPLLAGADRGKIEEAFKKLIARHESLRTSFHMINETLVQKVHDHVPFGIEQIEIRDQGLGIRDEKSLSKVFGPTFFQKGRSPEAIIKSFIRPFDLSYAPLLRVGLVKSSDGSHILLVDMHHIISDGVSHEILVKDYQALYNEEKIPSLRLQYKDFSEWQNGEKIKESLGRQGDYWLGLFAGDVPLLNFPTDFERPPVQGFAGDTIEFHIGQETEKALKMIALAEGATFFMVLLSIFTILLSKLGGQEDIIVGIDIEGRTHADIQHIIGMFVNALALRNFPVSGKTFRAYLQEVKAQTLGAFENQDYPFEELVAKISADRDPSRHPIFNVMFSFMDMKSLRKSPDITKKYPGLEPGSDFYKIKTAKFDLTLNAIENAYDIDFSQFSFEYSTQLFKKESIAQFIAYFKQIVISVVKNPDARISDIEMVGEGEYKRVLMAMGNDENTISSENRKESQPLPGLLTAEFDF